MTTRTYLIQTATLIAAAVLCALVSNAMASRERHMLHVGYYPNAQKVPPRETSTPAPIAPAAPAAPVVTTTTTTSQAPVAEAPVPVVKTTTQAPAVKPVVKPVPNEDPLRKFAPHEKQAYIEIAYEDVKLLHDHGVMFFDAPRTAVEEQGPMAGARGMTA